MNSILQMTGKVCVVLSLTVVGVFAQVNLQANVINFRQNNDADKGQRTLHYGVLEMHGNSSSYPVLNVVNDFTGTPNRYAIKGSSIQQANYGIGAHFEGGNRGVNGFSTITGTGMRYGGYFYASGGTVSNYGVYASAPTSSINYAGYFSGDAKVTGTLFYGNLSQVSDENLKKDAMPLTSSLQNILQLQPKSYYFDQTKKAAKDLPATKQFGLMAQEVEAIFPNLVTETSTDPDSLTGKSEKYKTVNYVALIPVLIGAIQEQQKRIDVLEAALKTR